MESRNQNEFLTDTDFPLEAESIEPDFYPPCKKCGKSHKMGVKTMATGRIEPMDICYDCLWIAECKPLTQQISFDDLPEVCDVNILQRELSETMKKIFVSD